MAGGIEWFRWHHGSVNDQKFGLVGKKAGASVAEVIAVWACLLEAASAAEQRGNPGTPDFEAMDFALGLDDGKSRRIYERMRERSLLDTDTGAISSWSKRQPKRERDDDNSTERSRKSRAAQRDATPEIDSATPCNAMQHQETPRGEESREEEKRVEKEEKGKRARARTPLAARPDDVSETVWQDFQAMRAAKRSPLTDTALSDIRREATKAGISLEEALSCCCAAGWQSFNAGWYANRQGSGNKADALDRRNKAAGAAWLNQSEPFV